MGGLNDVAGIDVALKPAAVPIHDLRRDEADEAEFDRMGVAGAIGDGAFEDDVGFDEGGIAAGVGGQAAFGDIGADEWEAGAGEGGVEEVEAVVEFVVAEG